MKENPRVSPHEAPTDDSEGDARFERDIWGLYDLEQVPSVVNEYQRILQRPEMEALSPAERERFIARLTGRKNPYEFEYENLARERADRRPDAQGSGAIGWYRFFADHPDRLREVRQKLKGEVVVDLGGGNEVFRPLAVFCEASSYVNVNLYHEHGPERKAQAAVDAGSSDAARDVRTGLLRFYQQEGTYDFKEKFPAIDERLHVGSTEQYLIKADMLDVASHIPDHSSHFALNAVDVYITGREGYLQALAHELERATRPEGIILCRSSEEIAARLQKGQFEIMSGTLDRASSGDINQAIFIRKGF